MSQQYLPFTVLKPKVETPATEVIASQQYLPFTVLKRNNFFAATMQRCWASQQYLPFTVLKRMEDHNHGRTTRVATVLTVYGIETNQQASNYIL